MGNYIFYILYIILTIIFNSIILQKITVFYILGVPLPWGKCTKSFSFHFRYYKQLSQNVILHHLSKLQKYYKLRTLHYFFKI